MATGQAQPPRLVEPFAKNATACTPEAPVAGGKTFPFPQPSQVSILSGAASLDDGFVPLNMTDPTAGGVPPFGVDMNGILFYLSSWCAYFAAGQLPFYDAALQTFMTGYAIGSVLAQVANPAARWTSIVDGNMTDPDTGGAGWVSSVPLYATAAPTAGTHSNTVPPTPSDMLLDYDCTAGNITLAGFVGQRNGQRLTLRKTDATANVLTIAALVGTAGNQLQAVGDYALGQQYADVTIQFNQAINSNVGAWVVV
jgi:hypothetical protein